MSRIPHGTVSRYNNGRCRCELCKDAKRQWRINNMPTPGDQPVGKFKVRYASAKVVLDPEPLITLITQTTELNSNMRARFREWRANGIDVYRADEWCVRIGTHPYLVFGDKFYEGCLL